MHKTCYIVAMIAAGLAAFTSLTLADLEGSKHDFTDPESGRDDLCGACHVPHNEEPPDVPPLWNPAANLDAMFGTTLRSDSVPGTGTTMCLTCHDGTLAPDFANAVRIDGPINVEHPGLFTSGHQTSNHPVGVEYPRVHDDFQPLVLVRSKGTVVVPDGRVECISCHDPHNDAGHEAMLVMSDDRSALCLTCHRK